MPAKLCFELLAARREAKLPSHLVASRSQVILGNADLPSKFCFETREAKLRMKARSQVKLGNEKTRKNEKNDKPEQQTWGNKS
ncbi:MAG: hypothetical protein ACREOO_25860 [bacterium]